MIIVENVLILNKPQAELNFATFSAIFGIDVNDVKCFNGTLLADHFLDPQSILRVL